MCYSPGPWTRGNETSDGWYIYDAKAEMVAHVSYQSDDLVERANARLIAAAPDLLAACQALLNDMPHEGLDCAEEVMAAIAKAERG